MIRKLSNEIDQLTGIVKCFKSDIQPIAIFYKATNIQCECYCDDNVNQQPK